MHCFIPNCACCDMLCICPHTRTQEEIWYEHSKKMFDGFKELGTFGQQYLLSQLKGASLLSEMLEWSKAHPRAKASIS